MRHLRFSLASFLICVSFLGVGMAIVRSQSQTLTNFLFTCYWVVLFLAVVGVRSQRPEQRTFWLGFALCGWTYWFLGFEQAPVRPASGLPISRWQPVERTRLITSNMIDFLEDHLSDRHQVGSHVMAVWKRSSLYAGVITEINQDDDEYLIRWDDGSPDQWTIRSEVFPDYARSRTGMHCLFGLMLSLVVGVLGLIVFPPDDRKELKSATEQS